MKYSEFSKERMLSQLPYYERLNNKMIQEIYRVLGDEADELFYKIEDLYKQFFIDTATWGLDAWEKSLDIQTPKNLTYEDRRAIIKTKLKKFGKVSTESLKSPIQLYFKQKVDVYFNNKLLFVIPLEGENLSVYELITDTIEDMKPAHLGCQIKMVIRPKRFFLTSGIVTTEGEHITVYPEKPEHIKPIAFLNVGSGYGGISKRTHIFGETNKEE